MKDFWIRVAIAVVATLVIAPFFGALLDHPFHRVMTRVFMVCAVVAFAWGAGHPREWTAKLRAMGLRGPDRHARFWYGACLALGLLFLLFAISFLLGGRGWAAPYRMGFAAHFGTALLAALFVSFFEEVVCRGYMKDALGNIQSALVFAAVHYIQPLRGSKPAGGYDPLLGVKRLGELVEAWSDPRNATLGVLSLFLFGLALNRLRERTGTLYAGIGVHAALVFALAFYRRFVDAQPRGDPWIFGGARIHDGVLGTAMLLILALIVYFAPLPARLRHAGLPKNSA